MPTRLPSQRHHACLPAARLVFLDATPHFAQVDTTERVVDELLPFLQGETHAA
jgi:pimeloyl-ACP methyl ester carboxylesterase